MITKYIEDRVLWLAFVIIAFMGTCFYYLTSDLTFMVGTLLWLNTFLVLKINLHMRKDG